eukprot:4560216-Pleurochrysis_carterae.AAC.1
MRARRASFSQALNFSRQSLSLGLSCRTCDRQGARARRRARARRSTLTRAQAQTLAAREEPVAEQTHKTQRHTQALHKQTGTKAHLHLVRRPARIAVDTRTGTRARTYKTARSYSCACARTHKHTHTHMHTKQQAYVLKQEDQTQGRAPSRARMQACSLSETAVSLQ